MTTATAGLVIGETIGPALVGVIWLGDRTREGLAWLAVLGFAVAVAGALALARFGEAPVEEPAKEPLQEGDGAQRSNRSILPSTSSNTY